MSEKTLKFTNIRIYKKEFHKSKQLIDLVSVNIEHIVISNKFKHSTMVLNISLVTKKMKLSNRYVLIYPK